MCYNYKKDKSRPGRLLLRCTNHLPDVLDPFFELSTPPAQPASFGSELFARHFRLPALPAGSVTGPGPPKNAFLSQRKGPLPRLITSGTTGLCVPQNLGKGPVADPWEVQDERWV